METYRIEQPRPAWGNKITLWESTNLRVDYLEIFEAGHSSIHVHQFQYNCFVLLRGKLKINIFRTDQKTLLSTIILGGDLNSYIIRPGIIHQFEAINSSLANEFIYFKPGDFDIERFSKNGVKS